MAGSPDISNPKLVTSTKETAAAGTTLEITPGSSFLSTAATTPTDLSAAVSVVIMGLSREIINSWPGYMNESGGSVSDYINTAVHGQYDTDFPELTSKFEKFSIGSSSNNAALFWEI